MPKKFPSRLMFKALVMSAWMIGGPLLSAEERWLFEDFQDATPLSDRFDEFMSKSTEEFPCRVEKVGGHLSMTCPEGLFVAAKSQAIGKWEDTGKVPVLYSVSYESQIGTKITYTRLYTRLGIEGLRNGYAIGHYYDGICAALTISRFNFGREESLFVSEYMIEKNQGVNRFPQLQKRAGTLSALIISQEDKVVIRVYFNGDFLTEIVDSAENRLKEGQAIACSYFNNEHSKDRVLGMDIYSLEVLADPKLP